MKDIIEKLGEDTIVKFLNIMEGTATFCNVYPVQTEDQYSGVQDLLNFQIKVFIKSVIKTEFHLYNKLIDIATDFKVAEISKISIGEDDYKIIYSKNQNEAKKYE